MKVTSLLAGFVYGFMAMIFMPLVLVWVNSLYHLPRLDNSLIQFLGALLVLGGAVLGICAVSLFRKYGNGGSPLPFDPPKKLVTSGIYGYIRNPMFTASAMVWFGEYLFFGSFLLLPYALAWVLFNHIHLILQDEKWLEKRFGKEYLDYKKKTPRYLPGFNN